jgi:hypothetical protein
VYQTLPNRPPHESSTADAALTILNDEETRSTSTKIQVDHTQLSKEAVFKFNTSSVVDINPDNPKAEVVFFGSVRYKQVNFVLERCAMSH